MSGRSEGNKRTALVLTGIVIGMYILSVAIILVRN